MGCLKIGHSHQWPTHGLLTIQRCETRCNFCTGKKAVKQWKFAWFLRRHVKAVHCKGRRGKAAEYPDIIVDEDWDGDKMKAMFDEMGSEKPNFVGQMMFDEQKLGASNFVSNFGSDSLEYHNVAGFMTGVSAGGVHDAFNGHESGATEQAGERPMGFVEDGEVGDDDDSDIWAKQDDDSSFILKRDDESDGSNIDVTIPNAAGNQVAPNFEGLDNVNYVALSNESLNDDGIDQAAIDSDNYQPGPADTFQPGLANAELRAGPARAWGCPAQRFYVEGYNDSMGFTFPTSETPVRMLTRDEWLEIESSAPLADLQAAQPFQAELNPNGRVMHTFLDTTEQLERDEQYTINTAVGCNLFTQAAFANNQQFINEMDAGGIYYHNN